MIEVKGLNKTYERAPGRDARVLRDVSLTLPDRGFVCILGPSGCGKTSLLNAVGGLDKFDSGTVRLDERVFTRCGQRAFELERDRNFGYIFQNYYLLESHTVAYNVYLGLHSLGLTHAEKLRRVRLALRTVDMELYLHRRVRELSGGQQQRVAIARALARRPRVIFADEPTGNLDEENTRAVCALLRRAAKDSLVVMVTHEERIARFFADRIITLANGIVTGDTTDWDRGDMALDSDKVLYAGGLEESAVEEGAVRLRILREKNAPPVELTLAVLRDRVVLKLADPRSASLTAPEELPVIREGRRPVVTLEELERDGDTQTALFHSPEAPHARPGRGLTLPMMLRQALELTRGHGLRQIGMRAFLALLTVLTLWAVGDYLNLSTVDPEDFITYDDHVLELSFEQGAELLEGTSLSVQEQNFLLELKDYAPVFDFVPYPSVRMSFDINVFSQLKSVRMTLDGRHSVAPLEKLDPSTLIAGRMPENGSEIVVDRQVLEKTLESGESIIKNSVKDLTFFLGVELQLESRRYKSTIVGICDSGQPSVYISPQMRLSFQNGGLNILPLSEAKRLYPDLISQDADIGIDECIVNLTAAGDIYSKAVGTKYQLKTKMIMSFLITDTVRLPEGEPAYIIVDDSMMDFIDVISTVSSRVLLYCEDKAAVKDYLRSAIAEAGSENMVISFSDPYQQQYRTYTDAARVKADARSIITLTVIVVCLVMLFLLCRTQANARVELLAVYRLLGIPRRKLHIIFLLEGTFHALTVILPAALVTWGAVAAVQRWTEIELRLLLPWPAAALVSLAILVYYLFSALIPLASLLRLPPARLAARYE